MPEHRIDRPEVAWLAATHRHGTPVLGVCGGAQLLAEALGGGVEAMGRTRLGWHPVRTSAVPAGPWFQWHADRIVLPPGAEVVADSDDGPEAFRVGSSVGVQFHPEMSADLLERWPALTPVDDVLAGELRRSAAHHEAEAVGRACRLLRALGVTG